MRAPTITYQELTALLKTLPPEHLISVYDYALFIKSQSAAPAQKDDFSESEAEIQADEEQWDQQFAASRDKLRNMAREASEAYRAGRTKPMKFTHKGRLER